MKLIYTQGGVYLADSVTEADGNTIVMEVFHAINYELSERKDR